MLAVPMVPKKLIWLPSFIVYASLWREERGATLSYGASVAIFQLGRLQRRITRFSPSCRAALPIMARAIRDMPKNLLTGFVCPRLSLGGFASKHTEASPRPSLGNTEAKGGVGARNLFKLNLRKTISFLCQENALTEPAIPRGFSAVPRES